MPTLSDISELPLVGLQRAEKFRASGIGSLEDLVNLDPNTLLSDPAWERDKTFINRDLPMIQGLALAHQRGEPVVLGRDERLFKLKEPIIHLDLEFDGPAGFIFLWGFRRHHGEAWHWFETSRAGQKRLLIEFRDLCKNEDPTIVTWGGTASDLVQLRNACDLHGIDKNWISKVKWLDLQAEIIYTGVPELQLIYLPVTRFKSENVAQYFGYKKPELKIKDGYSALKQYRKYRRNGDAAIYNALVEYNAEDVVHTELILDGLRKLMADA